MKRETTTDIPTPIDLVQNTENIDPIPCAGQHPDLRNTTGDNKHHSLGKGIPEITLEADGIPDPDQDLGTQTDLH